MVFGMDFRVCAGLSDIYTSAVLAPEACTWLRRRNNTANTTETLKSTLEIAGIPRKQSKHYWNSRNAHKTALPSLRRPTMERRENSLRAVAGRPRGGGGLRGACRREAPRGAAVEARAAAERGADPGARHTEPLAHTPLCSMVVCGAIKWNVHGVRDVRVRPR